jgi:hypothetical protein
MEVIRFSLTLASSQSTALKNRDRRNAKRAIDEDIADSSVTTMRGRCAVSPLISLVFGSLGQDFLAWPAMNTILDDHHARIFVTLEFPRESLDLAFRARLE